MVSASEEIGLRSKGEIYKVFDRIAWRYDIANTLLSFGRDRYWRRALVRRVGEYLRGRDDFILLDLATGTGEVVREFRKNCGDGGVLVGVDMSEGMLYVARGKWGELRGKNYILLVDGMEMGIGDNAVDAVTVAFGIRNVADVRRALAEIWRVLDWGGVVGILEFGLPRWGVWRFVYSLYLNNLLPLMGRVLTGDVSAYKYLRDTIRSFPSHEGFVELLGEAGFVDCRYEEFLGGAVLLYLAQKRRN